MEVWIRIKWGTSEIDISRGSSSLWYNPFNRSSSKVFPYHILNCTQSRNGPNSPLDFHLVL